MKIGLFYGSTTCYTEMVAEKIQAMIGAEHLDIHNIKHTTLSLIAEYDLIILGISTWDYGELQEDWEAKWDDLREIDLEGKIIAIYGLGDQAGYTEWFQDAMGMLYDVVITNQGTVIGEWPNTGYEFTASKGLTDDGKHFYGLALDDENQYDLTDERLKAWLPEIMSVYEALK